MLNGGSLDCFLLLASIKGQTDNFAPPTVSPGDTIDGLADTKTATCKLAPVQSESKCDSSS